MKNVLIILLFITNAFYSYGQKVTDFESIKLENAADCKAAEPFALEASNYLFSTPFQKEDIHRLKSIQFIIRWMAATPDFRFSLDEMATKLSKGNEDVLSLYLGAMTKFVLEHREQSGNEAVIRLNSITTILNFAENPSNNFKMSKGLRKLSEAKANGQLAQALE